MWEYMRDNCPGGVTYTIEEMNLHGLKGWELAGVTRNSSGDRTYYYKRPVSDVAK